MTDQWWVVAEGAGFAILLGATIALWWRGRRNLYADRDRRALRGPGRR